MSDPESGEPYSGYGCSVGLFGPGGGRGDPDRGSGCAGQTGSQDKAKFKWTLAVTIRLPFQIAYCQCQYTWTEVYKRKQWESMHMLGCTDNFMHMLGCIDNFMHMPECIGNFMEVQGGIGNFMLGQLS